VRSRKTQSKQPKVEARSSRRFTKRTPKQAKNGAVEGRPNSNSRITDHASRVTFHVSHSLLAWFADHARDLPWRRTRDPYAIWVSEVMLQQTQVKTVISYYERWMRALPTVQAVANASVEAIHKLWEGLGYYTRVRNMQQAARMIVERHGGRFPTNFDDVLALRGVGRYTAGAICSIAFNQPTPILDGNVIRVLTRVLGIRENPREKETNRRLWNIAAELVARAGQSSPIRSRSTPHASLAGNCSAWNQALMELGATVCAPRQPRCESCPLTALCVARREGIAEQLPNLGERIATTARRFAACVIESNGALLVRQRPVGIVNAHLWEFPNVETVPSASIRKTRRALETELGCELENCEAFRTVKHTITRYRITLDVFRGTLNGELPRAGCGKWMPIETLPQLAFASAHRKVLREILGTPAGDKSADG
jgi:A/G-specific adenine glycosylase